MSNTRGIRGRDVTICLLGLVTAIIEDCEIKTNDSNIARYIKSKFSSFRY